jgi:hypothetical protein
MSLITAVCHMWGKKDDDRQQLKMCRSIREHEGHLLRMGIWYGIWSIGPGADPFLHVFSRFCISSRLNSRRLNGVVGSCLGVIQGATSMGISELLEYVARKKESQVSLVKVGSTLVFLFSSSRSLENFQISRAHLDLSFSIDFMVVSQMDAWRSLLCMRTSLWYSLAKLDMMDFGSQFRTASLNLRLTVFLSARSYFSFLSCLCTRFVVLRTRWM